MSLLKDETLPLDDLITAQNQKIEALNTYKKSLIQQIFPDSNKACA